MFSLSEITGAIKGYTPYAFLKWAQGVSKLGFYTNILEDNDDTPKFWTTGFMAILTERLPKYHGKFEWNVKRGPPDADIVRKIGDDCQERVYVIEWGKAYNVKGNNDHYPLVRLYIDDDFVFWVNGKMFSTIVTLAHKEHKASEPFYLWGHRSGVFALKKEDGSLISTFMAISAKVVPGQHRPKHKGEIHASFFVHDPEWPDPREEGNIVDLDTSTWIDLGVQPSFDDIAQEEKEKALAVLAPKSEQEEVPEDVQEDAQTEPDPEPTPEPEENDDPEIDKAKGWGVKGGVPTPDDEPEESKYPWLREDSGRYTIYPRAYETAEHEWREIVVAKGKISFGLIGYKVGMIPLPVIRIGKKWSPDISDMALLKAYDDAKEPASIPRLGIWYARTGKKVTKADLAFSQRIYKAGFAEVWAIFPEGLYTLYNGKEESFVPREEQVEGLETE